MVRALDLNTELRKSFEMFCVLSHIDFVAFLGLSFSVSRSHSFILLKGESNQIPKNAILFYISFFFFLLHSNVIGRHLLQRRFDGGAKILFS